MPDHNPDDVLWSWWGKGRGGGSDGRGTLKARKGGAGLSGVSGQLPETVSVRSLVFS